jgi:hypothetical protein
MRTFQAEAVSVGLKAGINGKMLKVKFSID